MALNNAATVVLATTNKGKIAELAPLLAAAGLNVRVINEFGRMPEIVESGNTFLENARIKAQAAVNFTGCMALADDSGLVVPSLDGAPGVYSSRFGDDLEILPGETRDQRNMRKLREIFKQKPLLNREAFFQTVIVLLHPDGRELAAQGSWEGEILTEPRGANGFGYDPVFLDPSIGRTAAELGREEKSRRSHRGKAVAKLMDLLPDFLKG